MTPNIFGPFVIERAFFYLLLLLSYWYF